MGQPPFWMPAFLLSCRANPKIQWYIFSDMCEPTECPDNVKFIHMDIQDFNHRVSETLDLSIEIQPTYAYKIADFKSAYGVIFQKEVRDFDFWGHCDLDIVWGDIRRFIDNDILAEHDIITSRIQRISGHFCLFRNIPEINLTFSWIQNFSTRILDDRYISIDEDHLTDYLQVHLSPNWIVRLKYLFMKHQPVRPKVYWDKILTTSGAHQRSMGNGSNRCFWWRDGKTFNADAEEMMYIHFHIIKKSFKNINFTYDECPTEFMITREGIFIP